jgi:predicted transposase
VVQEVFESFQEKFHIDPITFTTFEQAKNLVSNSRLKHKNGSDISDDLKRLQIRDRLFLQCQCEYAENSISSNEVQRLLWIFDFTRQLTTGCT